MLYLPFIVESTTNQLQQVDMADAMVGTWKFESSDNFDNYLKEIGVNWANRQGANLTKPTLKIAIDGDHVVIKQESSLGNVKSEFDIGVEFDEKTPDGRKCKSKATWQNDDDKDNEQQQSTGPAAAAASCPTKLVQVQLNDKVNSTLTRYVDGDTLYVVSSSTFPPLASLRTFPTLFYFFVLFLSTDL